MKILFGLILIVSAGCASNPTSMRLPAANSGDQFQEVKSQEHESTSIDYISLQRDLGLERGAEELGYVEKIFDTCRAGYGYSSTQNCHPEYFVVIHFQLLCRDSEGTISTSLSASDLAPLSGRQLKWNLQSNAGALQLDSSGFGQIKTTLSSSPRAKRLRLNVGNEVLYMRAEEINRVVTPKPWCN